MTTTVSKRQRSVIARERERRAWTLYTEHGYSQAQIAAELHVSQRAVSKMIKRAEVAVANDLRGRVERERNRQHVKLEAAWRLSIQSFQESKGDCTIKTSTRKEAGSDSEVTTRIQVVRKTGDHGHMANALQALADMRKLHGLDAPVKSTSVNLKT